MDYKTAINEFIKRREYLNNQNLEGIVLYGSYNT